MSVALLLFSENNISANFGSQPLLLVCFRLRVEICLMNCSAKVELFRCRFNKHSQLHWIFSGIEYSVAYLRDDITIRTDTKKFNELCFSSGKSRHLSWILILSDYLFQTIYLCVGIIFYLLLRYCVQKDRAFMIIGHFYCIFYLDIG